MNYIHFELLLVGPALNESLFEKRTRSSFETVAVAKVRAVCNLLYQRDCQHSMLTVKLPNGEGLIALKSSRG